MENIAVSAIGGAIAGVVAAGILGVLGRLHRTRLRRREVDYIRDVFMQGRKRVMESKDMSFPEMKRTIEADAVGAAHYNLMIRQIDAALRHTARQVSNNQRKDLYDALDWFNTDGLSATRNEWGEPVFEDDLPLGRWPNRTMRESDAIRRFERLEQIKWLKLKPYEAGSRESLAPRKDRGTPGSIPAS